MHSSSTEESWTDGVYFHNRRCSLCGNAGYGINETYILATNVGMKAREIGGERFFVTYLDALDAE